MQYDRKEKKKKKRKSIFGLGSALKPQAWTSQEPCKGWKFAEIWSRRSILPWKSCATRSMVHRILPCMRNHDKIVRVAIAEEYVRLDWMDVSCWPHWRCGRVTSSCPGVPMSYLRPLSSKRTPADTFVRPRLTSPATATVSAAGSGPLLPLVDDDEKPINYNT